MGLDRKGSSSVLGRPGTAGVPPARTSGLPVSSEGFAERGDGAGFGFDAGLKVVEIVGERQKDDTVSVAGRRL